jgi:peptide/nickel transport system substrate-binding protein
MFKRRRKICLAGLAAVIAALMMAAGCTSTGSGKSGHLSSGGSVKNAVATLPIVTGTGPDCIFPFEGAQCYSTTNYEDFEWQMTLPLYIFGGNSSTNFTVDYTLSPAGKPLFKDGGKTVVINLKGWKWSNGETVDAKSLMFFLNMLEAEKAAYAGYTPGQLPDNLASYSATGPDQVTLQLKQAYGSTWFTYNQLAILTPMPLAWDVTSVHGAAGSGGCSADSAADQWAKCKAVHSFLDAQNKDTSTYATSPLWQVVDGPYHLTSYNVSGTFTFVPNQKYSGSPKAQVTLKFKQFASESAVHTALENGALTVSGPNIAVPSPYLPPAGKAFEPPSNPLASAGYKLVPTFQYGIGFAYINFNNPAYGPVFKQLYFRQALMELNDQRGMDISPVSRGYHYPTSSGVPSEPTAGNPFISSATTENGGEGPYPYDPKKAEALLAAHGWKKERGVLTCESAGTGSSDCGAGIAKGTQARFSFLERAGAPAEIVFINMLKSSFALAGIQLTPVAKSFDDLLRAAVPCTPAQSKCTWDFLYVGGWTFNGPGFEPTGEPVFLTGAPSNAGSYSDPVMDKLIHETHVSTSITAFHNYASYTAKQVPVLYLPLPVGVNAVSKDLHNVTWSPFQTWFPAYWRCATATCGAHHS